MSDITSVITAFFEAVSFETGGHPAYGRIHDLFIDGGKLIKTSGESPEIASVDEFIAPRQARVDSGSLTAFREFEVSELTEVFGNVAHRFSTYGKRGTQDGATFDGAGVITAQFIRTPGGWKMTTMAWDDERPGLAIPARLREGQG
jgi:hypothetical protein